MDPDSLPPVDAVVDSALLSKTVRELGPQVLERSGHVLISVSYDEYARMPRRDVIEHSVPPTIADSINRLLRGALRENDDLDAESGIRLNVVAAETVALEVSPRIFCPAVARNPELRSAMQSYSPTGVRVRGGVRERTIHVRARVDEFGLVQSARIIRGELSGGMLENQILRHLQQFAFQPATVDGRAISGLVDIPIIIRSNP